MHGEEIQTEQDATAHVPEVPVLEEVRANHERDGGEVQQVRERQVNDRDVHGGGEANRVAHHDQSVHVSRNANHVNKREQRAECGGDYQLVGGARVAVPGCACKRARLAEIHRACPCLKAPLRGGDFGR